MISATRSRTPARRATAVVAGLVLSLATLAGCGVPERVVGLRPAPVEPTTGAAFTEETAQTIATRVLAQADSALAAKDSADEAREAVLTGPALRIAEVPNRFGDQETTLTTRGTVQILGVSAGREWPRHILATTLDNGVQRLHVLLAIGPTDPYKVWVSAPLLPGVSVPPLPALAAGTEIVTDHAGLLAGPRRVLTAYGRLLDVPRKLKKSAYVTDDDAYAVAVQDASQAQRKALGKLGTFTRKHRVLGEKDTVSFALADGGVLAFGQFTRTDQLESTAKAKRLDLPADLARLAGTKSVTEKLSLRWLMTAVMVIPPGESARIVGVGEQLSAVSGK